VTILYDSVTSSFSLDLVQRLIFDAARRFESLPCFRPQENKTHTLVDPLDRATLLHRAR